MLSILVLYLGFYLNRKVRILSEFYIPPAVTGGLLCSTIVAVIYGVAAPVQPPRMGQVRPYKN